MSEQLTQNQLNAVRLIGALAEIAAVSTNPEFPWGREILKLISAHMGNWEPYVKQDIKDNLERILDAMSNPQHEALQPL